MAEAIKFAHETIKEVCALQRELAEKVQPQKIEFIPPADDGLFDRLKSTYYNDFKAAKQTSGKQARAEAVSALRDRAMADVIPDPDAEGAFDKNRFTI